MDVSLFRNVLYNWGGLAGNLIYGFFMVPFVIKHLGTTNYGLWNLVASVVGYVALLDCGVQSSVNRYVAKYRGTGETQQVNSVYSNALLVYALIASVALCGGIFLSLFLERIFSISSAAASGVIAVYLAMVCFGALELPLSVFGSILYAYQRFDLLNIGTVVSLILQSVLMVTVLRGSGTLQTFCLIVVGVGLARYAGNFIAAHRTVPDLRFSWSAFSGALLKSMLRFSGVTLAAIIANNIIFKTDNIVIGIFLGPEAVAMYSIGLALSEYASQLVTKMCNAFTPRFADHNSRGELLEQYSLLLSATRFSIMIGVPIGFAALVVGKDFINLWLGTGYDLTYRVMAILMGARMCAFPTAPLYSMLFGIGSHHLAVYTGMIEAVLNLGLSLFLVQTIGVTGVAWGTFVPMLLCNILLVVLVFRELELDLKQWVKRAVLPPALLSAAFLLIIHQPCRAFQATSWSLLALKGAGVAIVYVILFLFFGITRDERGQLMAILYSQLKGRTSLQRSPRE